MRFLLLGCEMLANEIRDAKTRSPHQVDLELLPAGLHNEGRKGMRTRIQEVIDAVDETRYDAILLGYALCGNGLAGVTARGIPLVITRAHDCITLLMGSAKKYARYYHDNLGTYFLSAGWIEHRDQIAPVNQPGWFTESLDDLIARYGENNGRYLYNEYRRYIDDYKKLAFIRTGVGHEAAAEQTAQRDAAENKWSFEIIKGNLRLFKKLLDGDWNEEFLVVNPGEMIQETYDEKIFQSVAVAEVESEAIPS